MAEHRMAQRGSAAPSTRTPNLRPALTHRLTWGQAPSIRHEARGPHPWPWGQGLSLVAPKPADLLACRPADLPTCWPADLPTC